MRNEELKKADVVVLTYACDEPESFQRVSSYWLPELKRLEVGFASFTGNFIAGIESVKLKSKPMLLFVSILNETGEGTCDCGWLQA